MIKSLIGATLFVFVALAGAFLYFNPLSAPSGSTSNADDAAVRAFVTEFGSTFKDVSLVAPDAAAQMKARYSDYVAPALLEAWATDTTQTPGWKGSNPWPDRVDVSWVVPQADGSFSVEAYVIEVASTTEGQDAPTGVYPISLTVRDLERGLTVVALTKGAYSELPQRTSITGTWECLPHKDTTGPQTTECAFGIKADYGVYYAISTTLMSTSAVDYPTGTKVRVEGVLTPVEQLSSIQKYDTMGVISATSIQKI